MSRPRDPFGSTPDDKDRSDPFVEQGDPLASSAPAGFGSTAGVESTDPFADATDDTADHDPFGSQSRGGRNAQRIVAAPFARRRLWLVGVVLLVALVVVGMLASPRDDNGRQTAQRSGGDDAPDPVSVDTPETELAPPSTIPSPASVLTTVSSPATTVATDSGTAQTAEPVSETLLGCGDQSGVDPHGLIRIDETTERLSFCGEETWQVFVCSTRESDRTDRVSYVVDVLGEAAEWFEWASAGQYDIDFSAGDDTRQVSSSTAEPQECFEEVLRTEWSGSRSGAVVLVDEAALDPFQNYVGLGTCGYVNSAVSGVFGESGRMVAIAVHADGDQSAIAVHELGHAQCWPHSYSGETGSEYDNPADVMSFNGWPVGTIAVNRYASGWIHPSAVRVHRSSTDTYTLVPCCSGGVQLLALLPEDVSEQTVDFNRQWWHLEVRDPEDEWERGLADTEVGEQIGVSVHWIDQNLGMGAERHQAQVGNQIDFWADAPMRFGKLKVAGSEFCLHADQPTSFIDCGSAHEWRIEVTSSRTGGLNLAVSPSA